MAGPVNENSVWVKEVPGEMFTPGALAPTARRQDLKHLADTLRAWALDRPEWLAQPAPASRAA
jgi:hypothetical protein